RLVGDQEVAGVLATQAADMFGVCVTPVGERMAAHLLLRPAAAAQAQAGHNVDAPMLAQDLGLVARDCVVRCRVEAAVALGQLAAALGPAQRMAAFAPLLLPALASPGALQQQLAAVVAEQLAVSAVDSEEAGGLHEQLRGALEAALARDAAYADLRGALGRVSADCAHLLAAMPSAAAAAVSPGDENAVAVAQQLLAQTAAATVSSAKHADDVATRRQRLAASVEYHAALQAQTDVSVKAAHAGALVALGRLPPKLNSLMRALMASLKTESCALLQDRAAHAVARLLALCYGAEARVPAADKLVRNLATLACADPAATPVFAERAAQREAILMLELVQREQAVDGSAASMAQAAAASAQASQRKHRRGALPDDAADAVPLVAQPLSEDQARAQAARLIVRGAEAALSAVAQLFAADLLPRVPRLWQCVADPLARHFSSDGDAADRHFAEHPADAQAAIDALRVLQALCAAQPPLHAACAAQVAEQALPW
ncbi:TATA-binding protein-associated factor mot1, partial [Coemansia sp. RSA 2603]